MSDPMSDRLPGPQPHRRPLRPLILALALGALVPGLGGCGGQPRDLNLESPTPPPPPPSAWRYFSDAERIVDIAPTPTAVWAISQNGVLRWSRPGGQVNFALGAGAPGADATAIAVATDGTVFVGLKDGITWKRPEPASQWQRLGADPLPAGVTALAPRKAGGVWIGMQRGLGWMHGGRLRLHSRLHTVRDLAVDDAGRLWAATASKGLVTLEGDRIVEHTTVTGLCHNDVRAVAVGGGQVAVVCNTPRPTVAVRVRNTWYPFSLSGGGAAVVAMQWVNGNWVIRSTGGWWRVVEVPPGTPAGPADTPARLEPLDPSRLAPPPALIQPARVMKAAARAAEAGAAPAPLPPVEEQLLECTRAPARVGDAASAPALRLLVERPNLPEEGEVTVWSVGPDGFAWYGLAWRGLLAQKGQATQRFTSQSLVPRHNTTRMAVDTQGRALIPSLGPYVTRWDGRGWERRPVAPLDSNAQALAVAADTRSGAWLLIGYPATNLPPPVTPAAPAEVDPVDAIAGAPTQVGPMAPSPEIAVVRIDQGRLERKARLPVLGIDRPLRVGQLDVGPLGEIIFSLFYEDVRGQLRGAGLGQVAVSHDVLVRWQARRSQGEESVDGTPLLPDGWVNAVARTTGAAGPKAVVLGTNSGLVRVQGGQTRVFDENDFIESEVITALAVDAQDRIWAGTLEGLGRLAGETWTAVPAPALTGRITRLAFDGNGRLWAGTDRGLFHNANPSDPKGWRAEPVRLGETARDVWDVVFGPDGSAWVLTGQGVFRRAPPTTP